MLAQISLISGTKNWDHIQKLIIKKVNYFYYTIYYLKNYFALKRKSRLVALIYKPNYLNELINLYRELIAQNIDIVLLFGDDFKRDKRFSENLYCSSFLVKNLPIKIILTDGGRKFPRYIKKIAMFHGFASLNAGFQIDFIENYDYLFLRMPYMKKQFESDEVPDRIKIKKIFNVGNPLLDGKIYPVNNPKHKKYRSFLYAPTYHVEISSIFYFFDIILKYTKKNKINLYIKLHPALYRLNDYSSSGNINWKKKIEKLCYCYDHIFYVQNDINLNDLRSIFNKVDLLITDTSAIGWEFCLITGKPVVFLGEKLKIPLDDLKKKNYERYFKYPEVYYRYNKLGPLIVSLKDFIKIMEDFKNEFDIYNNSIITFRKEFTFNLGKASKVAVNIIKKMLSETK